MAEIGAFKDERIRWEQFDEDTEVRVRYIPKTEMAKISARVDKVVRQTGAAPDAVAAKLIGRAAVKGWRKTKDHNHPGLLINGEPLVYSEDACDMLMANSYEFSRFVNSIATDRKAFIDDDDMVDGADDSKNV